MKKTDNETLVSALRILANDIQSDDGIANSCIAEAADRIEELAALRLFVWPEFAPDYVAGLAFAIANNHEDATKGAIESLGFDPGDWGPVQVLPLAPVAFAVYGGS